MQTAVQKDPIIAPKNVPDAPRPIDPELDAAAQNLIAQADVYPVDITEKGSAADVLETVLRQVAAFPLTPSQSRALSDFIAYIGADFATVALSDMTMRLLVSDQHPHAVNNADIQQWIILDGHGYQMGASIESVLENTIYGTKTSATKYNGLDISRVKNGQQALRIGLSSTRGENTKKIAPALLAAHLDTVRALAPTTPPQGITQIRQMIDLGTLSPAARELTRALADLGDARAHALMTAPTDTQPTLPSLTAIRQDPQPTPIQQTPLSQATIHQAPLSQAPLMSMVPLAVSNGTTPLVRIAPLDQAQKILGILNTPDRTATIPPAILQAAVHHITPYVQPADLATVRALATPTPAAPAPAATPLATSGTPIWTSAPAANDAKKPTAASDETQVAQIGDYAQQRPMTESERRAEAARRNRELLNQEAAPLPGDAATDKPSKAASAGMLSAEEVKPDVPNEDGSDEAAAAAVPATPVTPSKGFQEKVTPAPTPSVVTELPPETPVTPAAPAPKPVVKVAEKPAQPSTPPAKVATGTGPKPEPTPTRPSSPPPVTNIAPPAPPAPVLKVVPPVAPPPVPVKPIQPTEPILRAPTAPPKEPTSPKERPTTPTSLTSTFKSSCGIEGCDGGENCPVRALGRTKEEGKKKAPEVKPAFHAACTDENCTQCVSQAPKKAVFKKKNQAEMAIT